MGTDSVPRVFERSLPLILRAIGSIFFVAMDFNPLKIINDDQRVP